VPSYQNKNNEMLKDAWIPIIQKIALTQHHFAFEIIFLISAWIPPFGSCHGG
jgi:hypothetical protein